MDLFPETAPPNSGQCFLKKMMVAATVLMTAKTLSLNQDWPGKRSNLGLPRLLPEKIAGNPPNYILKKNTLTVQLSIAVLLYRVPLPNLAGIIFFKSI
jgi:hypothetical protein